MFLKNKFFFQIKCGTRASLPIGLIHGGTLVNRGEYPWYVNISILLQILKKLHYVWLDYCLGKPQNRSNFNF